MAVRYITVTPITNLFKPATRAFGDVAIVGKVDNDATGPLKTPVPVTNPDSVSDKSNVSGANQPVDSTSWFKGDLGTSVRKALSQNPGPTTVYAVAIDPADSTNGISLALAEVAKLSVQIVVLANTPLTPLSGQSAIESLATHVNGVSNTGADGMERLYGAAFAHGINVVSANKKPLALAQGEYDHLRSAARRHYRAHHYETTVGAALPVVETLRNLVRTGDEVIQIQGSFSGTLGFLCERLSAGVRLSAAVAEAQDRGFTEPNPRDDLSGLDVARKALILARELGLRLDLEDILLAPFVPAEFLREADPTLFLEQLVGLDAIMANYVASLRTRGLLLRYLASIEPGSDAPKVTVGPIPVPADHPAGSLRGAEAMVAFTTKRYREYPLIVRGAGAGGAVTASGVLADILRLAQNLRGHG